MDLPRRERTSGNGNRHEQRASEPRFTQDETGATLDSGTAVCRFNAHNGGRMEWWQWRTLPPPVASAPATRHDPPRLLDLVDRRHGALIDHFWPLGTLPAQVEAGEQNEYGDFLTGQYRFQVVDSGGEIRIGLLRDGEIRAGRRVAEVRMAKSAAVRPTSSDVAVLYRVINSSARPMQILFSVEFNVCAPGLADPESERKGFFLIDGSRPEDSTLGSGGVSPNCTHVALVNPEGEMALQLGWDRQCDLWRMSPHGGGPAVRLFAVWRIQLPPKDNWAMGLWLAPA